MSTPSESRATPYRTVNLAGLILALYGLAQPVILPLLHRVLPDRWMECASLRLFGLPCPLCGLTRGLRALLSGDARTAAAWNPLVISVLVLLVAEIAYRTTLLVVERRRTMPRAVMRTDIALHGLLAAAYLAYAAGFILGSV